MLQSNHLILEQSSVGPCSKAGATLSGESTTEITGPCGDGASVLQAAVLWLSW